jgi:hypothetical protein
MLNDWKTKHGGTVDRRKSVTGATIAQGWGLSIGTMAIILDTAAMPTDIAATIAVRATKVIKVIAATG